MGADGERGSITVMRDILRAMGEGEGAFDWVRDRPRARPVLSDRQPSIVASGYYGRLACVVKPLGELGQEAHLLGGRLSDEVPVEDERLVGRVLALRLLLGSSSGELLG